MELYSPHSTPYVYIRRQTCCMRGCMDAIAKTLLNFKGVLLILNTLARFI